MSNSIDNKSVTICIPVFNAKDQIERCICAALESYTRGCQILVLDNCSTDGTAEIATKLLRDIAGARVILHKENIGRIANWNMGFELCETKYIRFALVNDVVMKNSTDILHSYALDNEKVVQVFSKENVCTGIAGEVPTMQKAETVTNLDSNSTLKQFAEHGCAVVCSLNGILFCAETIKKHGLQFYDHIPFFADYKFNIEVAALGNSVFTPSPSVMVDRSVKGRFFNTGGDGGTLLREYRVACDALDRILKERGIANYDAYQSQFSLLKSWFLSRGGVRPFDCIKSFSSMPYYQFLSLGYLLSLRPRLLSRRIRRQFELRAKLNALLSSIRLR